MIRLFILLNACIGSFAFQFAPPSNLAGSPTSHHMMKTELEEDSSSDTSNRRRFFGQVVASSIGFGMVMKESQNNLNSCGCGITDCPVCGVRFGPMPAYAYERDVGDDTRSADSAAQNLQARETNDRLARGGFKLDTKEEEQARLNDAFASFSYDSIADSSKSRGGKQSASRYQKAKSE